MVFILDRPHVPEGRDRARQKVGADEAVARMMLKPDWFGFETETVAAKLHIQHSGQIFPIHIDSLIKQRRSDEAFEDMKHRPDKYERFNVQLQDWVWGHLWAVGNSHWNQWRAGEIMYHPWWTIPHGTANCSYAPRYSLQVNGVSTDVTKSRIKLRDEQIDLSQL